MLIDINNNLNFKDELKLIISLGVDTLKLQIIIDYDENIFSFIESSMPDYIVITQEPNGVGHIIYDNSEINPDTLHGTSIGRIYNDMITLYGLNQMHECKSQLQLLKLIFSQYNYIIRQLDFNIDVFGVDKDRISCVYNTNTKRFSVPPREQLQSNYLNLNGIGTTNIAMPINTKHKLLITKIKKILSSNPSNIQYVGISILSTYKTYKIRDKNPTHILFKVQEQNHLKAITKLIDSGDYKIDFNPFFEKGNHKDIYLKSSKRSLIKHYNKSQRYLSKGYDEMIIDDYIYEVTTAFKESYVSDDDEYDEFELQNPNSWIRTEFVNQFEKIHQLSFHATQIDFLSSKVHQKTKKLKIRLFNIGQRGKSQLHEYIKLNNAKTPKEIYTLEAKKNNFYEYQPSQEEITQTLKEFISSIENIERP